MSFLPSKLVPYAELCRVNQIYSILYPFLPYLFGTLFAACISEPSTTPSTLLSINLVLFAANFLFHGAAVAFNDIMDYDVDRQITRTRLRPIARGAVTVRSACIIVGMLLLLWYGVMTLLPARCLYYAFPYLVVNAFYPMTKRITFLTPVVLGFTFAWAMFIGCSALGLDPETLVVGRSRSTTIAFLCLYTSTAIWTIIYETIYAHQDVRDDAKFKVKSMAVHLGHRAKQFLSVMTVLQVSLLVVTGICMNAGLVFFCGTCGLTAIALAIVIRRVNLEKPADCKWWHKNELWFVGGSITAGLFGEYLFRLA